MFSLDGGPLDQRDMSHIDGLINYPTLLHWCDKILHSDYITSRCRWTHSVDVDVDGLIVTKYWNITTTSHIIKVVNSQLYDSSTVRRYNLDKSYWIHPWVWRHFSLRLCNHMDMSQKCGPPKLSVKKTWNSSTVNLLKIWRSPSLETYPGMCSTAEQFRAGKTTACPHRWCGKAVAQSQVWHAQAHRE